MAKYRDKSSMGRSEISPQGRDHWKVRHARRKSTAHQSEVDLAKWCEERGLVLKVNNSGHHRIIRHDPVAGLSVEWWPSTAKAVTRLDAKRYRRGIHCHDVEQLKQIVENQLKKGSGNGN